MRTRSWLVEAGGTAAGDAGLLILRLFAGLALALAHGWGKIPPSEQFVGWIGGMGFPAPAAFAWMAALAEFVGGLLLAAGLLTRPAAFVVTVHFLVVAFVAHAGDTFRERELALMFGVVALTLLLTGPGRYSADAALEGRRR
jgi:putative oxidoreductase